MYEHHTEKLLTLRQFIFRLFTHALVAFSLLGVSLGAGIIGYRYAEGLSWIDSLLNAAMILGGMGPVSEMHRVSGKLFASVYALYSGMVFLVIAGIIVAPVYHRIAHRLHFEEQ